MTSTNFKPVFHQDVPQWRNVHTSHSNVTSLLKWRWVKHEHKELRKFPSLVATKKKKKIKWSFIKIREFDSRGCFRRRSVPHSRLPARKAEALQTGWREGMIRLLERNFSFASTNPECVKVFQMIRLDSGPRRAIQEHGRKPLLLTFTSQLSGDLNDEEAPNQKLAQKITK